MTTLKFFHNERTDYNSEGVKFHSGPNYNNTADSLFLNLSQNNTIENNKSKRLDNPEN